MLHRLKRAPKRSYAKGWAGGTLVHPCDMERSTGPRTSTLPAELACTYLTSDYVAVCAMFALVSLSRGADFKAQGPSYPAASCSKRPAGNRTRMGRRRRRTSWSRRSRCRRQSTAQCVSAGVLYAHAVCHPVVSATHACWVSSVPRNPTPCASPAPAPLSADHMMLRSMQLTAEAFECHAREGVCGGRAGHVAPR